MEAKEAEEVLSRLVAGGQGTSGAKYLKAIGNLADKSRGNKKPRRAEEEEEVERKRPFNADSIKKIGYDPSALARAAGLGKDEKKRKEESIALLKAPGEGFRFDPRKKVKVVNVRAPLGVKKVSESSDREGGLDLAMGEFREERDDKDESMIDLD